MPTRSAPSVRNARISAGRLEARAGRRRGRRPRAAACRARRRPRAGRRAARGRRRAPGSGSAGRARRRWADQRVEAQQVDVVGERHEAARAGLGAQRAGGVGEHERLGAEQLAACGPASRPRRPSIALVDVRAAAQARRPGMPASVPEHERARVAGDRADAEAGQVGVRDRRPRPRARRRARRGPEPSTSAERAAEARRPLARRRRRPRARRSRRQALRAEGSGSSSPSVVVRRTPLEAGEVDRRVRVGELAQALAAAAARRDDARRRRGDDDLDDAARRRRRPSRRCADASAHWPCG